MSSNKHHTTTDDCIHESVMNRLQNDKVTIRPRFYHVAGSVLVGIGIAGTIVSSVFFTHVVLYRVRAEQIWGLAGFGAHGLYAFIRYFPWPALLIAVVGLVGGTRLLKQYDFGCKHRLSRVMIASGAVIISFGMLLEYVDFGQRIRSYSFVENMYRERMPLRIVEGTITRVSPRTLRVRLASGEDIVLEMGAFRHARTLKKNDTIRAFGRMEHDSLQVQKLHVISVK